MNKCWHVTLRSLLAFGLFPCSFLAAALAGTNNGDTVTEDSAKSIKIAGDVFGKDMVTKVDSIELSDEVLLSGIEHLDVGPEGQFLIVDRRQVFLFDKRGNFIRELQPEQCHPGFTMRPIDAKFAGNRYILMTNGGPMGYRFHIDGSCLGGVADEFRPPEEFTFDEDGRIYGMYPPYGGPAVIKQMTAEGTTISTFDLPETDFPAIERRFDQRGLLYSDGFLYFASAATTPSIYKLSPAGELAAVIGEEPSFYEPISRDFRPGAGRGAFIEEARRIADEASLVSELSLLKEDRLLLQYVLADDEDFGYQIFSADGKLLAEHAPIDRIFIHAENRRAYSWKQSGRNEQGEVPTRLSQRAAEIHENGHICPAECITHT